MKTFELRHKQVVVIGAGISGMAAAELLHRQGAIPFVSDSGAIRPERRERLQQLGIAFEQGGHSERALTGDLLVVSPGVPRTIAPIRVYRESGRSVWTELELAWRYNRSPVVAVTGTNGKTTVTRWLGDLFERGGKPAVVAGNIGVAVSDVADHTAPDAHLLLEVSSYQLEFVETFRPDVSIILNITPDHMDYYGGRFEDYAAAKFRITEHQTENDFFITNADDEVMSAFLPELKKRARHPRILTFSARNEVEEGLFLRGDTLIFKFNQTEEPLMQIQEFHLSGQHNVMNGMAAALAARVSEIKNSAIRESLTRFEGVEHRLEPVRELDGVTYINDSKATNVNAVWFALDSFDQPMVLILGGRDKGNDYRELEEQLREKVHTVIAIGEAADAIEAQVGPMVPELLRADSMGQAVRMARKQAKRGELVMLSPACSSFDMFENFEDRGNAFRQAVLEL